MSMASHLREPPGSEQAVFILLALLVCGTQLDVCRVHHTYG